MVSFAKVGQTVWRCARHARPNGGRQRAIRWLLSRPRRGLSLLELILALGLSALVLYAISMAVDLHLRSLDIRRTHVEESQIARAVLSMIANDLRGAIPQHRVDMSAVEQMAMNALTGSIGAAAQAAGGSSQGGTSGGGGSGGTTGAPGGSTGGSTSGSSTAGGRSMSAGGQNSLPGSLADANSPASAGSSRSTGSNGSGSGGGRQGSSATTGTAGVSSGGAGGAGSGAGSLANSAGSSGQSSNDTTSGMEGTSDDGSTPNNTNLASSGNVPPVVGLYGNQYELQIDVSHLPRPDQYWVMATDLANPALPSIPSDVKTVTYFVQSPDMANGQVRDRLAGQSAGASPAVGLVRREIDRSVFLYAAGYGSTDKILQSGDLLAPEVIGVQFQYFDGTTWLSYWDSEQMGGLPVAVEVVLLIQPRVRSSSGFSFLGFGSAGATVVEPLAYRLLVHLPLSNADAAAQSQTEQGLENLGL